MNRSASLVSASFLILIAAAHMLRLIFSVPVVIGGLDVPVWVSVPAMILSGILALLLLRERRVQGIGNSV